MEFKNLIVYQKALSNFQEIESRILILKELDRNLKDQLRRASISIILNIAEGSSRFSMADRKNFLVISRGSAFECSAILDIIAFKLNISFSGIQNILEEISKMLYKMITTLRESEEYTMKKKNVFERR
ncbi:MAG TPA: four helix bundle protein [Bacteroidia bacterium]|nr:four helix bundle protein [Bacteroidia bacterium]